MTTKTTTDLTIKVSDYEVGTNITTQYGMRFPDGHISWTTVSGTRSMERINVQFIHEGTHGEPERWERSLKERASAARIDLDQYKEGHEVVKRTVILVTTDIEDVQA